MDKQRFTFGTTVGTSELRGNPDFLMRFNRYLTEEKRVNPAEYEFVTIASCAATLSSLRGRLRILSTSQYALMKYGSICHGTHISNAQNRT